MSKADLILHLGAPKCGSTALQSALCSQPELSSRNGADIRYAVLTHNGGLIGKEIRHRVRLSQRASISSVGDRALTPHSAAFFKSIMSSSDKRILLSNEGWFLSNANIRPILASIDAKIDAIVFVRPPVDFANSAWWQWNAWTKGGFDQFLDSATGNMAKFVAAAKSWRAITEASGGQFFIKPLPSDVLAAFNSTFGTELSPAKVANRSLSGTVLRLFQRFPELRPNAHASLIDSVLEQHLSIKHSPTPWVIPQADVEELISASRKSCLELREMFSSEDQTQMDSDPRWWDAETYREKTLTSASYEQDSADHLELLAFDLVQALVGLHEENKRLKASSIEQLPSFIADFRRSPIQKIKRTISGRFGARPGPRPSQL